ncbi:hypothetical protein KA005_47905, partial [bacterium]|nr:hypothetical protein [bacterium]
NGIDIKSIRFDGENLLEANLVSEILSNEIFEISEIGGIRPISSDNYVKFYINNRGRVGIYGDPSTITIENIYNLIRDVEDILPTEGQKRGD